VREDVEFEREDNKE